MKSIDFINCTFSLMSGISFLYIHDTANLITLKKIYFSNSVILNFLMLFSYSDAIISDCLLRNISSFSNYLIDFSYGNIYFISSIAIKISSGYINIEFGNISINNLFIYNNYENMIKMNNNLLLSLINLNIRDPFTSINILNAKFLKIMSNFNGSVKNLIIF